MRQAETIVWPAGEHAFRLAVGELRALEQRCDAGVVVILMRLLGQSWKVDDVVQVLRLGLIGGGMAEREAQTTIDKALDSASLMALSVPAADILRRFVMWEGEDQPGEAPAGKAKSRTRSKTAKPAGRATTVPEQ